jgi:hypothetical protein
MRLYGSYTKLIANSKQAMIAVLEIYNKPNFDHREQTVVMLLVNAWELLLLAILSKNKQKIYQTKKRDSKTKHKTLSFFTAYDQATNFFLNYKKCAEEMRKGLEKIVEYRNNVVHYYNENDQLLHALFALFQAAIKNYVDLVYKIFKIDITKEINIVLLPLSFNKQPDFVEFFQNISTDKHIPFVKDLFIQLKEIEQTGQNDRFITQCTVKIESKNNIKYADCVASYDKNSKAVAIKEVDLDKSHPFFQKDIIGSKNTHPHKKLKHKKLTSYKFQAIVIELKKERKYCWISDKGGSPRYSVETINYINSLSKEDIEKHVIKYKAMQADKRRKKS